MSHIVPNGVVCLFSAWNYYQLSDFVPPEYHIAIEKTHKVALPDYPPIKVYYWSEKYWNIGITEVRVGNTMVKIYDKEKSVCDAIRYRNKVGKMEARKYEIEKYIGDWHWNEPSHALAFEMGTFLYNFIDYLEESGLAAATIQKHVNNTWCIGYLTCHYGYYDAFSPEIFSSPPYFPLFPSTLFALLLMFHIYNYTFELAFLI